MNSSQLGNIGEIKTISKLIENQIPVFTPVGDGNTVDLIAIINGQCVKIQVKTTEKIHDTLMTWNVARQEGFHGNRAKYNEGDIDYFALYCLESDILCFVPYCEIGLSAYSIRSEAYEGKRTKSMHFANDYSFENIFLK